MFKVIFSIKNACNLFLNTMRRDILKIMFHCSQREQMNNKNVMKADHSKKKKHKADGKKSVTLKKHKDSEK